VTAIVNVVAGLRTRLGFPIGSFDRGLLGSASNADDRVGTAARYRGYVTTTSSAPIARGKGAYIRSPVNYSPMKPKAGTEPRHYVRVPIPIGPFRQHPYQYVTDGRPPVMARLLKPRATLHQPVRETGLMPTWMATVPIPTSSYSTAARPAARINPSSAFASGKDATDVGRYR
jgi:hypothetical protein